MAERTRAAGRVAVLALALAVGAAVPSSAGTTVEPVADAMVRFDHPATNYGGTSILRAGYSYEREVRSFLRFSLPVGSTGFATLRVHVQRGNGGIARVYLVANDSWAEGSITWNSAPPLGALVGTFPASPGWHSVRVPVSGGLNSFALRKFEGPGDPGPTSSVGRDEVAKLSSRETAHEPELVL